VLNLSGLRVNQDLTQVQFNLVPLLTNQTVAAKLLVLLHPDASWSFRRSTNSLTAYSIRVIKLRQEQAFQMP
jgi:hypothetical protein